MEVAWSVHGVPIRLTAERWLHIVEARDDLVGREDDVLSTVRNPDWITKGYRGSMMASSSQPFLREVPRRGIKYGRPRFATKRRSQNTSDIAATRSVPRETN